MVKVEKLLNALIVRIAVLGTVKDLGDFSPQFIVFPILKAYKDVNFFVSNFVKILIWNERSFHKKDHSKRLS